MTRDSKLSFHCLLYRFYNETQSYNQYTSITLTFCDKKIGPNKYTLLSGNAGDKKNLHPGGRKFIFFLIDFPEIFFFLFQFLLLCLILVFVCLFVCYFLELNMYICGRVNEKKIPLDQFPKARLLFLALVYPIFISFLESQYVNILH